MSLTSSNTYIEPTSGTSLNTARLQQNDNFRSLLANFYSSAAPVAVNITAAGVAIGPVDGMLYRSSTNGALYIWDTANKKRSPIGGNFTRVGIGNRVEESLTTLNTNNSTYDTGELVALMDSGRLYLRKDNTVGLGAFVDVGSPQGYTIDVLNNATFTGQSIIAPIMRAATNVAINTNSPSRRLHVVGDALISTDAYLGQYVYHEGDTNTFLGFPAADTFVINTNGSERMRIDSEGEVGFGTTSPAARVHIVGAAQTSAAFNTANSTGALLVGDTATAAGSGGAIVFGSNMGATRWAAIKGHVDSATSNSIGSLRFFVRNNAADPNLTERIRVDNTGQTVFTSVGTSQLGIWGNTIIGGPGIAGTSDIRVNFVGASLGTSQFRDVNIYDGKSALVASFTGFNKTFTTQGNVVVGSNVIFADSTRLNTDPRLQFSANVSATGLSEILLTDLFNNPSSVTVAFSGLSTTAASNVLVQLVNASDAAVTTGYTAGSTRATGPLSVGPVTNGFPVLVNDGTLALSGLLQIYRNGNETVSSHTCVIGSGVSVTGAGRLGYSGSWAGIRISPITATTFDAGTVFVTWTRR